jgi:hypothetical protein
MNKIVLLTTLFLSTLLFNLETKGQNSVYILTEVWDINYDSIYVTAPNGSVNSFQIPTASNIAAHDSSLNLIINGITNLGYTIADYHLLRNVVYPSSQVKQTHRWYFKKP